MKFLSLFLVCLLGLVGCQKKPPKANDVQLIRLNIRGEPATMDPRKGGDVISSHMHFMLFEGLVKLNQDGSITPAQAKTFHISEDGKTYTFFLRDTVWSDGSAVTAYDFETSWKDILDPGFPSVNAHLLYPIVNAEAAKRGSVSLDEVGIKAIDEKTLVVTLTQPTPYFLDLISFCVFFPVNHKNDRASPEWAYNMGPTFISNGPFILKEWKHNNEIVAVKNPHYWDNHTVRPETIHFSMIDNEMTALQMFENGKLDMIGEPLSPLPVDALPTLFKTGALLKYPTAGTNIITFNVTKPPFTNANIRKALAYAINRESIVKNITQMGEVIAANAVPPLLKNNRNHKFFKDHDIKLAKELMAKGMEELGMKISDFQNVVFHYPASDLNHKIAQAIQQQWLQELDVHIKLEGLELKVMMDKLTKRDYLVAQSFWFAQYNDQMNILERFKFKTNAKNYPHWENPEYIQLLDQSFFENGMQRAATLEKAEAILMEEMPLTCIFHRDMPYMVQPHLLDVGITPIGDIVFEKLNITETKDRR